MDIINFFPDIGDPPGTQNGFWPGYMLRAIADAEDIINKDWDDIIQNDTTFD
jgi:hypothetical protein